MKEWESRGLVHAEMGLDWTSVYVSCQPLVMAEGQGPLGAEADNDRIGWSHNVYNEELSRVFEYGAM